MQCNCSVFSGYLQMYPFLSKVQLKKMRTSQTLNAGVQDAKKAIDFERYLSRILLKFISGISNFESTLNVFPFDYVTILKHLHIHHNII